jgi:PPOX class probable F420-dependent enzyme
LDCASKSNKGVSPEVWSLLEKARVARLATINEDGTPHVVPVVFAGDRSLLYFAIDDKPKKSKNLKRLRNIRRESRVTLLIDNYEENWDKLSYLIIYSKAKILMKRDRLEIQRAVQLLRKKYRQYRDGRYFLKSDVCVVQVTPISWVFWKASSGNVP